MNYKNKFINDGVIVLPPLLPLETLLPLQLECDKELEKNKSKNDYLFGNACRIGSFEQNRHSPIGQAFDIPIIFGLMKDLLGNINFTEIFITHEWKNNQMERNGFLHFDRIHTLKAMIYLTDVDKSSGAFTCSVGSNIIGKRLREEQWKQTQDYSLLKNRLDIDYQDLEYSDPLPIEGKAGTLILFDTDTFHMGGNVETGKERKVVRLHFRK